MWIYLGTALVLWGAKLIGDKKISGWLWSILGDACWITGGTYIFIETKNPSVIVCELLFLILHFRGLLKWRKSNA